MSKVRRDIVRLVNCCGWSMRCVVCSVGVQVVHHVFLKIPEEILKAMQCIELCLCNNDKN
jgi:fatty acid desaturase